MFLNLLEEKEKIGFYSLAKELALANKIITQEEDEMLKDYILEMKISECKLNMSLLDAIEIISKASKKVRKITIFELVGLVYADNEFDIHEEKMIIDLCEKLDITKSEFEEMKNYILKYKSLCKDIYSYINS